MKDFPFRTPRYDTKFLKRRSLSNIPFQLRLKNLVIGGHHASSNAGKTRKVEKQKTKQSILTLISLSQKVNKGEDERKVGRSEEKERNDEVKARESKRKREWKKESPLNSEKKPTNNQQINQLQEQQKPKKHQAKQANHHWESFDLTFKQWNYWIPKSWSKSFLIHGSRTL